MIYGKVSVGEGDNQHKYNGFCYIKETQESALVLEAGYILKYRDMNFEDRIQNIIKEKKDKIA